MNITNMIIGLAIVLTTARMYSIYKPKSKDSQHIALMSFGTGIIFLTGFSASCFWVALVQLALATVILLCCEESLKKEYLERKRNMKRKKAISLAKARQLRNMGYTPTQSSARAC